MHPSRKPTSANANPLAHTGGKENRGASSHTASSSSSSVSTTPPKPLRARQTVHPLALADPAALHAKNDRNRAMGGTRNAADSAASISTAPPPPLPRRRGNAAEEAASSAAATSAAAHSTAAASSSTAASSVSAGIARPPAALSRPINNSSKSSSSAAWNTRTTALIRRVASHWRLLTRTHLVSMGLDHRGDMMRMRHVVGLWLEKTRRSKAKWQSWIPFATAARLERLGKAFARFRAKCTAPDRPSIRLATAVNLRGKADKFRIRFALRSWKHVYARGVLLQDQAEQTASMRATFLVRAALHSWIGRRHMIHTAAHAGAQLQLVQARRLRADAWTQWRSAQESSALDRVASGVARKHAYRSSLRSAFKGWKRTVGQGIDRDRRAGLQLTRLHLRQLRAAWAEWHRGIHRMRVLGSVVAKRMVVLIREAKRDLLIRWHTAMLDLRASARLMHIASRFRIRCLRIHALRQWGESVRLIRVRKMMGAASFDLLKRKWNSWRAALALRRVQAKREKTADFHAAFQRLFRAVEAWRRFARSSRKQRALDQTADEFLQQHSGQRLVRRWASQTRASIIAAAHARLSSTFRHDSLVRQGLKALRSMVSKRHARSSLHRLLIRGRRLRAFHVWKSFSDARVAAYESAKRARRFAWIYRLRSTFVAWRAIRRRTASIEARLMTRARPMLLRSAHKVFRHWSILAASSRALHRKMALAQQVDRSTLLQSSFGLWRDRFQIVRIERSQNEMALSHARRRLFAKVMFAWDSYAYQQQHARRQIQEGVHRVRMRLQFTQRQRIFVLWRSQFLARRHHAQMAAQAELHHARCVVYRSYRSWQLQTRRLQTLKAKLTMLTQRRFWSLWQLALSLRRRELHKHMQALSFWARRVMRLAWSGWAKFHSLQRHKSHLLAQAQEFRRANLRRHAARQWITAGLDLHESSLLIAHRAALDSWNSPMTLVARRAALKYARLWRYKTKIRRSSDKRRGGVITNQIVGMLPFPRVNAAASSSASAVSVFRPAPLPMRVVDEGEKKYDTSERKMLSLSSSASSLPFVISSSSSSNPVSSFEAAAAMFPRLEPVARPPPRQPVDIRLEELLRQPLITQSLPPAFSALQGFGTQPSASVAPAPFVAAAPASVAPSGFSTPLRSGYGGSDASFSPLPPSSYFAAAAASPDVAVAPSADLTSLESHLHRLLEWKSEAKSRRVRLANIEAQLARSSAAAGRDPSSSSSSQLQLEYSQLQSLVAADVDHRSYWLEQVQQVQRQIQALIQQEHE